MRWRCPTTGCLARRRRHRPAKRCRPRLGLAHASAWRRHPRDLKRRAWRFFRHRCRFRRHRRHFQRFSCGFDRYRRPVRTQLRCPRTPSLALFSPSSALCAPALAFSVSRAALFSLPETSASASRGEKSAMRGAWNGSVGAKSVAERGIRATGKGIRVARVAWRGMERTCRDAFGGSNGEAGRDHARNRNTASSTMRGISMSTNRVRCGVKALAKSRPSTCQAPMSRPVAVL